MIPDVSRAELLKKIERLERALARVQQRAPVQGGNDADAWIRWAGRRADAIDAERRLLGQLPPRQTVAERRSGNTRATPP